MRIDFDVPFNYTGEGNLLVAYLNGTGDYPGSSYVFNTFSIASSSIDYYHDTSPISPSSPSASYNYKRDFVPCTKFHVWPEGVEYCYPPMNLTVSNITSTEAEITWEPNEDATSSEYGIAYKAEDSDEWIELESSLSAESYSITDLDPFTRYDVKVWTVCSDANSNEVSVNFCTNVDESLIQYLPYYEDFDNADDMAEWTITNGTVTNKWYHGTIENNTMIDEETLTDGGAMYISNDGGTTNAYTVDATSIAYFSTFVGFGEGPDFKLTFDRKQIGENGWDYVRVYLMDVDAELSNTTLPDASYAISSQLGSTENEEGIASWVTEEIFIPNTYANTTKKLVFMWRNDDGGGENPPAAIDNIAITELVCGQLNDVAVTTEDMDGSVNANVSFTDDNSNSSEYIVEYKVETESEWMTYTSTDNPVVVPDLLYGKRYELRVYAVCDGADTSFVSETVTFNTPCAVIADLPYVTGFEDTFQAADGMIGNRTAPLCWYNINGGYQYYYWSNSTSTSYVYEGTQSLYLYGTSYSYSTYDFSEWFISPVFELTGNERVNFKAKAPYTENSPVLKIYAKDVTDGDITSAADTSSFTLVETINLTVSDNFKDYEINLSDYSGNTRFALVVDQMSSSFYIDSLVVSVIPDCPDVYDLAVSPASSESVSVSFNTGNSNGSGWVIAYGQAETAEEFDPEAAETVTVSDAEELPYIIDGLTAGETYYFAVQQDCGGAFTAPVAVTLPVTVTLPYEQNFDDAENMAEIIIDNNTATNQWHYGTAVNNTVDESGTPTAGGAIYISDDNGVTNNYNLNSISIVYFSTVIEFGEENGYILTFDRKQAGESTYDYTRVYLMDMDQELTSSIPDASYAITDILKTTNSAWVSDTVILDGSYANTLKKLVFMWRNDGTQGTQPPAAIDNIKLEARSCVEVTDLVLATEDAGESASIIVSFTDPNEAGNYIIEYKSSDESEWTVLTDISDNPYMIEELSYATQYDIRVKAVCSDEYSSNYVQSSIRTSCAILPLPWAESFDENITTSPCWDRKSGSFPAGTIQTSSLSTSSYGWSHSTTDQVNGVVDSRMRVEVYSTNKYWLITPSVDLGDGSTTYQIAADVMLRKWYSDIDPTFDSDDMFAILVSTDNGTSWSSANALVYKDGDEDTEHDFSDLGRTPTRAIYKLVDADDNPITGQVRFAFYGGSTTYTSGVDNYLYIDNVEVGEWNECPAPYAVTVSNIGAETATVSFNEAGDATSWEYVLLENGETDPEAGSPVEVTENPIELTGLYAGTTYAVAVRSGCGSPWSAVVSFTTTTALPYSTDFSDETDNAGWTVTTSGTNTWAIGSATAEDEGGMSAYVSNDGGTTYAAASESSIMYMSRTFDFGDGSVTYNIDFDYKISGYIEGTTVYSGILVFALDPDVVLPSTGLPTQEEAALLYGAEDWTHTTVELTGLSGSKQIVFVTWGYNQTGAANVPAAIDNISIEETSCVMPTEISVSNVTGSTADISWTGTSDSYVIYYRPVDGTDEDIQSVEADSSPFTLTDLMPSTDYGFAIVGVCGSDSSAYTDYYLFQTTCVPVTELPWEEGFEGTTANNELPACMEATGLGTYVQTYTSAQSYYNRAARTGTKFASFRWSSDDYIFTPTFELIGGNEYTFSFWYVTDGNNGWTTLEAKLCSGQTEADVISTIGTAVSSPVNDVYQEYVGTFTPEEDGVYSIAIHCVSTSYVSVHRRFVIDGRGRRYRTGTMFGANQPYSYEHHRDDSRVDMDGRRQREFMAGKIGRRRRDG